MTTPLTVPVVPFSSGRDTSARSVTRVPTAGRAGCAIRAARAADGKEAEPTCWLLGTGVRGQAGPPAERSARKGPARAPRGAVPLR